MNELTVDNEIRDLQLSKLSNLPQNDKLKVIAELLGYRQMPVTIEQFLDDRYYMGDIAENLYPFWKDKAKEIFPDPIHTNYPFLVFTGGIGTGKSTFVRFLAEYQKHRLCCLKDPHRTFGFVPGKNIKFSYFHKTGQLAQTDFLDVLNDWETMSPYFQELHANGSHLQKVEQVCDSVRSNNNIGSDVIFYNLSELNFISFEAAQAKLDMALKRFNSRFDRLRRYFGLVIIDTSSQGDDSIADDFIQNNPYGDDVYSIHTNKWIVREHMHYYGNKGWFKVFTGDGIHQPFIVKPAAGKIVTPDMDPDRVIDVPEEVRGDFEFDLTTALQDIAGISVSSTDNFFPDTEKFKKSFTLPQYGPDVVKFDFWDKTDKLIYRFDKTINSIPRDRIIFIRYDIGVTGDNTGLAIAYFEKWKVYDTDKTVRQPIINVPLAVGINRFQGQETPIDHLYEFILDLDKKFEIGCFTADQYASRQLLQSLTREGIKNQYLSVDRTDEAGVYTKSLANSGCLNIANNALLMKEGCELKRIGNKLDHPTSGCFIGSTEVICFDLQLLELVNITINNLIDNYPKYLILTYNISEDKFELSTIENVFETKDVSELIKLEFEDGSIYHCTLDHPILTSTGYKLARDLDTSDDIISLY